MDGVDETLPVAQAADVPEVLRAVAAALESGFAAAMATVVARRGSTPSTPGQKLALTAGGCFGTVGGGAVEAAVLRELRASLARAEAGEGAVRAETFRLGPELGMCCGGSVDVMIEELPAACPVGIVGAGHVAVETTRLLAALGFAVTLADARDAFASPERFPAARVLCGEPSALVSWVPRSGAVLVMTHDHQRDHDAIAWALREGYAFVGAVGSRAKAARTGARLEMRGFSEADRARVRIPVGLDIGARSPAEIAVSIAAELVRWRAARVASRDAQRRAGEGVLSG